MDPVDCLANQETKELAQKRSFAGAQDDIICCIVVILSDSCHPKSCQD